MELIDINEAQANFAKNLDYIQDYALIWEFRKKTAHTESRLIMALSAERICKNEKKSWEANPDEALKAESLRRVTSVNDMDLIDALENKRWYKLAAGFANIAWGSKRKAIVDDKDVGFLGMLMGNWLVNIADMDPNQVDDLVAATLLPRTLTAAMANEWVRAFTRWDEDMECFVEAVPGMPGIEYVQEYCIIAD